MATIDVFTFISDGIMPYVELMKKSAHFFASKNHQIYFKAIQSGEVKEIPPRGMTIVDKVEQISTSNSYNHSIAMNKATRYITSDYAVFIDADVCLLYKGWDEVVIKELVSNNCFGLCRCKENFPSVFMFCFKRSLVDSVKLDFTPDISKNGESVKRYYIKSDEEANHRRAHIGSQVKCDTGFRLPLIMEGNGEGLKAIRWCDTESKLSKLDKTQQTLFKDKKEHMCEWHYDYLFNQGELFATHKQACRAHSLNDVYGKTWKMRIDEYTNKTFNIIF